MASEISSQQVEYFEKAKSKRRPQARSIETRWRIIQAAAREFARHGFEGTTTRSIAQRAKVRHALIVYHFETKLGVWQAVMRETVGEFQAAFKQRLEGLQGVDDVTKLKLLQADFVRMSAERPELHWLMSHEAGDDGERIRWLVENVLGGDFEMFADLIRTAQKDGKYVEGDPNHLHYLFLGAAVRVFTASHQVAQVIGRSPFDKDFIEDHIILCQKLFFR